MDFKKLLYGAFIVGAAYSCDLKNSVDVEVKQNYTNSQGLKTTYTLYYDGSATLVNSQQSVFDNGDNIADLISVGDKKYTRFKDYVSQKELFDRADWSLENAAFGFKK